MGLRTCRWTAMYLFLLLAMATSTGAWAYSSATTHNRTDVTASGWMTYPGCKGEGYSVAPCATWTSPCFRGGCLISRITMNKAGKPVTDYTSSGTGYSRFVITSTALGHRIWSYDELKGAMPEGSEVAASVLQQPFYNIAHMTNTKAAVDWAVGQGANGVEMDLRYNQDGEPSSFRHEGVCDCSCVPLFPPASHVCTALLPAGDRCNATVDAADQLRHVAKKGLALVYIDNKIDGNTPADQGAKLVRFLVEHLFKQGHQGIAVIGGISETTLFLHSAATTAKGYEYADRIYFAMDEFGSDKKLGTKGLISKLVKQVGTSNRIYGTGLTSCTAGQYYTESATGVKHQAAGVVSSTYIWTVDREDTMVKYINLGVRGIVTNRPSAVRDLLKNHEIKLAQPSYRPPAASSNASP